MINISYFYNAISPSDWLMNFISSINRNESFLYGITAFLSYKSIP